jgi:hypothetical protein
LRNHDIGAADDGRVVWLRDVVSVGEEDESPPASATASSQ